MNVLVSLAKTKAHVETWSTSTAAPACVASPVTGARRVSDGWSTAEMALINNRDDSY